MSTRSVVVAAVLALCHGGARADDRSGVRPEVLSLPTGPGSIEGLGESFEPNPNSGTSSYSVPVAVPPGANGFVPSLALRYSSGAGNGELGLGWSLGLPAVQRGTDRGLPRYDDGDRIVLRNMDGRGAEDLAQMPDGSFRFRIEGAFVRGRRRPDGSWEFRNRSGVRFRFGTTPTSTTADGDRVFCWNLTEQEDPWGNSIRYEWERDGTGHPYLARIVYNDHGAMVRNEVVLSYEGRPDVLTSYLPTFANTIARRLSTIEVRHGGETVRTYTLRYQMMAGASRLTEVALVGRDGESTLPPTTLTYADLRTDASRVVTMAAAPARALGDVGEIDDVDGDALPDLLLMDSSLEGGRYVWYPNLDGTSFGPRRVMSSSPSVWLASNDVQLADMDGDGSADVVARLSSASDGFRYYPGGDPDGFGASVVISPNPSFGFEDPDVRLVDLDHDRLTDWMRIDPATGRISVAFNQGGGSFTSPEARPSLSDAEVLSFSRSNLSLADMNGDGLTDVVAVRSGSVRYWPSVGFGYFSGAVDLPGAPSLSDSELSEVQVRDLDGDGLSDVVHVGVSQVRYWLNRSGAALGAEALITGTPERRPTTVVRVADMNGNGTNDIVWVDSADSAAPWRYLDVLEDGTPGLLTGIDNGLGKAVRIEYLGMGAMRAWARDNGLDWTRRSPIGQLLVASVTVGDGLGSQTTRLYRYVDGYYDGDAREFRGFARAFQFDQGDAEQPTLLTESTFDCGDVDEASKGMQLSSRRMTEDGSVFDEEANAYEVRTLASAADGEPVRFAYATVRERRVYEGGTEPTVVRTVLEQDDYGNVIREESLGRYRDGDPSLGDDERTVVRTYAISAEQWIVDRVASEVTQDGDGMRVAETRTYYDGPAFEGLPLGEVERGGVTRVEAWVGTDRFVDTVRNERDAYGNVVVTLDARGGRRETEYDSESYTFVVAARVFPTEDRALSWTADWDRAFGRITAITGPNGHTERAFYDALGRPERLILPGDVEEMPTLRFEYDLGSPISTIRQEQREVTGEAGVVTTITHVDGLGRTRAVMAEATDRRWASSGIVSYGARGWERFREHPRHERSADFREAVEESGVWTQYDGLGRAIVEREVDGAERRTTYIPLGTVVHDENDADPSSDHHDTPATLLEDGLGRLRRVVELDGAREVETRYSYDAAGNLIQVVDAEDRVRRYFYDGLSRRIRIEDPNAGTWRLEYDDTGNLIGRYDPVGNVVEWEHDLAGRPLHEWHTLSGEDERRLMTSHHYDVPSGEHPDLDNTAGRLAWVEDQAGMVFFGYDARGRGTDRIRRWEDGEEHHTWTDFDATGRPVRRGFPDRTYLPIEYDERGLLRSAGGIIDDARWTAWGSLDEVTYGNGVVDQRRYDARLRVERMVATDSGGTALRDLSFDLDPASRITGIRDGREGIDPRLDLSAEYVFDDRYRLVQATDRVATTTWTYDDVANILSVRSGHDAPFLNVDNRYGEGGAGPDQLTHFGDERIRYDAAGRVVEDGSRRLFWDAKGRLARVERGDVVEEYTYAHDDTRAIKRTVTPDDTTTVRYIDQDVEERGGHIVRYVFLGDQRVVRLDPLAPGARAAYSVPPLEVPPAALWGMALALVAVLLLQGRVRRLRVAAIASVALAAACMDADDSPRDDAEPITEWPSDATLYLADQVGSVVATADATGILESSTAFHPYGAPRADSTTAEPWTYVGNESDTGSGLADFQARPYRPEMGRFLAVDPLPLFSPLEPDASPQRLVAYAYAAGDPVGRRDPHGLFVIALNFGGEGGGGEGRTALGGLWLAVDLNGLRAGWHTTTGRGPRVGPGVSGGVSVTLHIAGNEDDFAGRADTFGANAGTIGGELSIPKRSHWTKSGVTVGVPGASGAVNAEGVAGSHYSTRTEAEEALRVGASRARARENDRQRRRSAERAAQPRRELEWESEQISRQRSRGQTVSVDAEGVHHQGGSPNMSVESESDWPTAWPRR